jgi:hypothetical protein
VAQATMILLHNGKLHSCQNNATVMLPLAPNHLQITLFGEKQSAK